MYKTCEFCGGDYIPDEYNKATQKYCSKSCKYKMAWSKQKETGHIRTKKGGYNRSTYINLFLDARQADQTAPCHYAQFGVNPDCQLRVSSDDFILDHKQPVSALSTRQEVMSPLNLVVCCRSCNILKSTKSYEDFIKQ